jgi:hypothetical protein
MMRYYENRKTGLILEAAEPPKDGLVLLRAFGAKGGGFIIKENQIEDFAREIDKPADKKARVTFFFRGEPIQTVEVTEFVNQNRRDFIWDAYQKAKDECDPLDRHKLRLTNGYLVMNGYSIEYPEGY